MFRLPAAEFAHSRHYMPWEKKGPQDRALIFDTFVAVNREARIDCHWPDAALDEQALSTLQRLLTNMTFLGRCESWVEASVDSASAAQTANWNCVPIGSDEIDPQLVLCADPSSCFGSKYYPKIDAKKFAKGKVKPSDFLFDCPSSLSRHRNHQREPLVSGAGSEVGSLYAAEV
jgi:CRISPR-associated protein Csb2